MFETFETNTIDALPLLGPHPADSLEHGKILIFANLPFTLTPAEQTLIAQGAIEGTAKNISYNPATKTTKGTTAEGETLTVLTALLARFSNFAETLVTTIAPAYRAGLTTGRTSFRPAEIDGRENSWRKDDRRRHIDAFPSTPTGGARLLRVFANVDQSGTPRHWKAGPDFETYASTFLPKIPRPIPGAASLMALFGLTKTRRTQYDQLMLGLHDAAKRDQNWQATAPAADIAFAPGTIWTVFTDQVPHAALSGRNALEQTFYVTPASLYNPSLAPQSILESLTGRPVLTPCF